MTALCDNLRPAPFHYGTIALRLLGKLGGRNRRFLSEPMQLPPSTGTSWHTTDCFKVRRVFFIYLEAFLFLFWRWWWWWW